MPKTPLADFEVSVQSVIGVALSKGIHPVVLIGALEMHKTELVNMILNPQPQPEAEQPIIQS